MPYDPTIEDTYLKRTIVDGIPCLLELTDTAGQDEYSSLRDQWIKDGEAFLICYSLTRRSSFTRVKMCFDEITRIMNPNIDFDPSLVIIVGNKSNSSFEREVSPLEGLALAQELGCNFVETSAKMGENVEQVFTELVRLRRRKLQIQNVLSLYRPRRTLLGSTRFAIPPDEDLTSSGRQRLLVSLIKAAQTNDETMVVALIKCKIDINQQMANDGSALHSISAAGHVNIVNILIKRGAAVNARKATRSTPLQLAAAEGHLEVVRLLLHRGALINQTGGSHGTALTAAASRGRMSVVSHLLKKQANVDIVGGPYGTALDAACWNGDPQLVTQLLNAGANIRSRGNKECTVLQMAAFAGHTSVVQCLLDRGAGIDIDTPGIKYGSALKAAHDYGNYSAMRILLDAGAATEGLRVSKASGMETTRIGSYRSEYSDVDMAKVRIPIYPDYRKVLSSSVVTPRSSSTDMRSKLAPRRQPISDFGFSTIQSLEMANIDIVFVHGLQGHPEKTWTYTGNSSRHVGKRPLKDRLLGRTSGRGVEQVVSEDPVFWPRDLLASSGDFAQSRILVWGYDTQVGHFFSASDQQNISQHGNNFLITLQQERKEDPNRPLLFVAHSLGGIIVKVALRNSRGSTHQPQYLSIYKSTRGIIFLGTPHGGSQAANWGLVASNIIKCTLQDLAERVLRGLTPNNELLESL
ncbi:ankyrin repeat-containing domain protein [Xylaria digitata]|nr:ankyrin repeat-containing domain protein [Xylaria digitata]